MANGLAIQTTQATFSGTYTILLIIEPNGPSSGVTPVEVEYELVITACRVNTISVATPQPDITYYLGTGPITIPDGFFNEQPQCTITYSLEEEGTGTFDSNIFTFTPTSPVITIDTSDLNLQLAEKTLILLATSDLSGSTA